MADAPRFPGSPVTLAGESYVLPPLSLGAVKRLLPRLQTMRVLEGGVPDAETVDTMLEVITAALQRNYPAMTAADLAELIDLGNVTDLFAAVTGQSGLERKDGAAGERTPGRA